MSFLKATGKAVADIIPGMGKLGFDGRLGKIFVTSGTGVVGYRVAMSLMEAGHKDIRVGVWRGERDAGAGKGNHEFVDNIIKMLEAKGAEVVDFDWTDPMCFDSVLKGVKTVFCSLPHMEAHQDAFVGFVVACKEKKVEHFVKISFLHNDEYRKNVPLAHFHNVCDELLEQAPKTSRINYTVLATSHLMSTPLLTQGELLTKDLKYVTASHGMGVNYVSPNDVADAALVVLEDRKTHRNKVYSLTARPITDREVAKQLTIAYETPVQHIELGYHDYVKSIKSRGLPTWLAKDSAAFEKMKASGIDENPEIYSKDLENLIGRKPETFIDYLRNTDSQRPGKKFPEKKFASASA
jgi:NAD(P)H dehydrogenase (quinone)